MQVIYRNFPQFHPKRLKSQLFPVCRTPCKFWWLKRFETLKINQASYAVCVFEERLAVYCTKTLQKDPDFSETKKSNMNVSHANCLNFLRIAIVRRVKTFNNEQRRYQISVLKVNCSFTLAKRRNDFKQIGKSHTLAVFFDILATFE